MTIKKNPAEGGNLQTGNISAEANHKSFCNRDTAFIAGAGVWGLLPASLASWIVRRGCNYEQR